MKTSPQERELDSKDDFWTEHQPFFTTQFDSYCPKPQKVWGRFHTSEERYFGTASEIIPLEHKKGNKTYIMMQPYVLEPKLTLTIGIYDKPKKYHDQDSPILPVGRQVKEYKIYQKGG